MSSKILPLFPEHKIYVEPFCGAGTLLFARESPAAVEVLNDINSLVHNFFITIKTNKTALIDRLNHCPYSQELYNEARVLCKIGGGSPVEMAEAFFVNVMQSFGNKLNDSWGTDKSAGNLNSYNNRKVHIEACALRLMNVTISNEDALKCIDRWDSPDTLFYCDPPYVGTRQGHYHGYGEIDLVSLIEKLDAIQGRFLLSHCPTDLVPCWWNEERFKAQTCITLKRSRGNSERTECVYTKAGVEEDYDLFRHVQ